MADVGDEFLDGDIDDTSFGDLDGEEEDALLADDDYDTYQSSRQGLMISKSSHQEERRTEKFIIVDQVQDVSDGDEILEDGEEDILELAVVDELDESELDNGQGNNQAWTETSSRSVEANSGRGEQLVGVTSTSSIGAIGGDSDEEENDGRGSRFKTERTNIISLKGVTSGKSLSEIPDSLDNVRTTAPRPGMRPRGGMHRGGRGSIRGRLGPHPQAGMMMRGGFGPMRRPGMMPPPQQHPPPGHKILINPHFRGGEHRPQSVWDSERLPPPPGCEGFVPQNPYKDNGWGAPPPYHMGRPPFSPQHPPGPPVPFHNPPQMYPPPQHSQGYEEQYRPMTEGSQQGHPNRIVQFSENTQLITVENQHFQRPAFDQNFNPPSNQFQPPHNAPPHYTNNVFPNQLNDSLPRPNFQQQQYPPTPNPPQNFMGYPPQEFHPPPNPNPPSFQNMDGNQNNWNAPPQHVNSHPNHFYPPGLPPQHHQPPAFSSPQQPPFQHPRPPFQNQQPMFRPPHPAPFQGPVRDVGMKRPAPRQPLTTTTIPMKQMRFDHVKKPQPVINRTNLQEIKTVDNLPDTTTKQEPEIEEDEETKQYRLKIAEQKALREKILREKEARRQASIIEKQRLQEKDPNTKVNIVSVAPSRPPQPQPPPQQLQQVSQKRARKEKRGRNAANKFIPKQQLTPTNVTASAKPVVKIQQMMGTIYKIVKVRTKEGAIVTRKTPLVMNPSGTARTPMKTVSSTNSTQTQRRIVLNPLQQASVRAQTQPVRGRGIVRGGMMRGSANNVRMASATLNQGRTLFTVQTTPQPIIPKQGNQRVVIDNRYPNPAIKVETPVIPKSTLVTIENLSLSTSKTYIQKLAREVGTLTSFKHEADFKRATLTFKNPNEAEQFYLKFHRKMIDLSRIVVTVVPQ